METKIKNNEFVDFLEEMSTSELQEISAGGIAYDVGFFVREMLIYAKYGGGAGVIAASMDFSVYYRPAN
ncbi:MAG: hypothetical protein IPN68_19665 [Bacteroidetes bacterium]|nr:hypothetical protein [Bacteroidota bacterium]